MTILGGFRGTRVLSLLLIYVGDNLIQTELNRVRSTSLPPEVNTAQPKGHYLQTLMT